MEIRRHSCTQWCRGPGGVDLRTGEVLQPVRGHRAAAVGLCGAEQTPYSD